MKFRVSSTLEYTIRNEGTILLNLHASKTPSQTVYEESFVVEPAGKSQELWSATGENRFLRLDISESLNIKISYSATVDTRYQLLSAELLDDTPLSLYTTYVLMYLNPSRYCQSDKLYRFAENKFGKIKNGFEKVLAVCDWIYNNIQYLPGSTNAQTSAFDTITEQAGVCRDFAHLGIALCRALTIPARYFTGYAYQLKPADFHACFEAFLGGKWIIFDATRLAPLNGLVKIATSKDAADASFAGLFGEVSSQTVSVSCEVLDPGFLPVSYQSQDINGVTFD